MCVYLEHLKPFVKCPEGTQGDGKKCYLPRLGPTEAYCPPDYEQSPDGKACVKQNITKPQPVCPDGFMLKQGSCFREMRSPGVPSEPPLELSSEFNVNRVSIRCFHCFLQAVLSVIN